MATKTQYYNLDKPSYDEVADIEIINANMDKIDQQMRNNADGVNFAKAISSDAYDNSKLYAVGDYCIYDNKLYRCITAIESAEAFNVGKWEQTTVGKEVKQLNSNLGALGKCKNLLNPTLKTTTQNGVTCTNNGDGTYTLNGTATQNTTFNVYIREQDWEVGKTYRFIGCPSGGSRNSYFISPFYGYSSDSLTDYGNGCTFTVTDDVKSYTTIIIFIRQEFTCNNMVFKPMLTTNLNTTYDDFVPYTGDGETLTEDVAELKNDLAIKNITSQLAYNADVVSDLRVLRTGNVVEAYFVVNADSNKLNIISGLPNSASRYSICPVFNNVTPYKPVDASVCISNNIIHLYTSSQITDGCVSLKYICE